MLRSTTNKSFLQKRHAFIEYETKIMQSIYNKLKTYFPAEIRRIIWQLTIENHNSISYNDIVVSSDNPRDCEEIYLRFQGCYKLLFITTKEKGEEIQKCINTAEQAYKEKINNALAELKQTINDTFNTCCNDSEQEMKIL